MCISRLTRTCCWPIGRRSVREIFPPASCPTTSTTWRRRDCDRQTCRQPRQRTGQPCIARCTVTGSRWCPRTFRPWKGDLTSSKVRGNLKLTVYMYLLLSGLVKLCLLFIQLFEKQVYILTSHLKRARKRPKHCDGTHYCVPLKIVLK